MGSTGRRTQTRDTRVQLLLEERENLNNI